MSDIANVPAEIAEPPMNERSEPVRAIAVRQPLVYVSDIAVSAGATITAHVSSPAAHRVEIVAVDPELVTRPAPEARAAATVVASADHAAAANHPVRPGSYVRIDDTPTGPPLTLGAWIRLWRLPVIDVVQWAWSTVIGDFDYPDRCRFALLIDHAGRVGCYVGDGVFRHEQLVLGAPCMADRLAEWVHVAATIDVDGVAAAFVDGARLATGAAVDLGAPTTEARVRIAASAEGGEVDGFLDADVAAPFLATSALARADLERLVADRARTPLAELLPSAELWGEWPFDDPAAPFADRSGHERHGVAANEPVLGIGGPSADRSRGLADSDPAADPDRGHAARFASDDLVDARWPVAVSCDVPADARSGIYAARLVLAGERPDDVAHAPFVVSRRTPRHAQSVAVLCATNTWLAYGRRPRSSGSTIGLTSSFYSRHLSGNPFFHVGVRLPLPQIDPFGYESSRAERQRHSHLVRPELLAMAWLDRRGVRYEVVADVDVHEEPALLGRFAAVMIPGHNEYWSDEMHAGFERYLADGGAIVSLSGNTGHWRVTIDRRAGLIESRKVIGGDDARWLTPKTRGDRWHCHGGGAGGWMVELGRPAHELIGVDTQGMIDDGTPTAFSGFSVLAPDHRLFHDPAPVPVGADGLIGVASLNGPMASGYEFDATAQRLGLRDSLPEGLVVLASAVGQHNLEWNGVERDHGGDIVYWERPQGGRVLAIGSIGASGALLADASIDALVANALTRFGVSVAAPRQLVTVQSDDSVI